MDTGKLNKVRTIAWDARRWVEKICAIDKKREYREFYNGCGGACGVASAHLYTMLDKAGIPAQIVESVDHAFVLCDDMIIDITATQFCDTEVNFPAVCIMEKSAVKERQYWWKVKRVHKSLRSFAISQRIWPKRQRASYWRRFLGKPSKEIVVSRA